MTSDSDPVAAPAEGEGAPPSKEAIFNTALQLFARQGFAATGMRQIATEAGVNLATINYFYGSKVGLLRVILETFSANFVDVLETNLAGDEAPDVRIRRTVKAIAEYFSRQPERVIITISELPHDTPEIIDLKLDMHHRLAAVFERHIFDRLDADLRERLPLALIGPAIASLVASRFLFRPVVEKSRYAGYDPADIESYAENIAELVLNGISGLMAKNGGLMAKGKTS